jgi:hypothetical protein
MIISANGPPTTEISPTRQKNGKLRNRFKETIAGLPICFILFLGSGLLYESYHSPVFFAAAIVGVGGFAVCCVLFSFAFRCPRCHKLIMAVNTPRTSVLSFPNFCSNCGLDLTVNSQL